MSSLEISSPYETNSKSDEKENYISKEKTQEKKT
jgi:hypothetical protein